MKNYGHFTEDGKEYVITDLKGLPRKWETYMSNKDFACNIYQDGTGVSFYKHEGGKRTYLIKTLRRIFIRDQEKDSFFDFPANGENNTTTYGMGYAVFNTENDGINASMRITVPENIDGECWKLTVRNGSQEKRKLSLYTYSDIDLTGYFTPFALKCVEVEHKKELNAITYTNKDAYCPTTHYNAFISSDTPIAGFDTVGEIFFGLGERNMDKPEAVLEGSCRNSINMGGNGDYAHESDMIGALEFDIELAPGEEKEIQVLMGIFEEVAEVEAAINQYAVAGSLDKDLKLYTEKMNEFMNNVQIDTPDKEIDRLFNFWVKYNLKFVSQWTRLYSRGFRDTLQDTMGLVSLDLEFAKKNILTALSHEYASGKCKRAWDTAQDALSDEHYADGPIWIPLTINEYIRESGDLSILQEVCPYLDGGTGTVLEHMLRAVRFLYNDRGDHGLCRIHDGDWCDTAHLLGKKGIGEGVWLSIALYNALMEIADLAEFMEDFELKKEMELKASEMVKVVNEHGWDGDRFLIAYNDQGQKIGSKDNEEGQLFLNPQSWAVISGITTAEREKMCFDNIDNELDSEVGPLLLTPPFTEVDKNIGTLTSFHPGTIENGSCYCHAASFKIVADSERGRGNKAYETMRKIMPGGDADQANPNADCPPYAFTNSRIAPFHPYLAGRSFSIWTTGTVSWCWQAMTERILGVRRTFEGLSIEPCIPGKWDGYKVRRVFRGRVYNIEVLNPDHLETGVKEITVNGRVIENNLLPLNDTKEYNVKVIMG